MDRFEWDPDRVQPTEQPRVQAVKFGDGYEQRAQDGINHLLRSYTLEFSGRPALIGQIAAFLREKSGVTAFQWLAPDTWELITVVCEQWNGPIAGPWRTLSCTFREVPA